MDFSYTKEQKELRQEIINFAKENLNDKEILETFSWKMWEKIADFGLLGITVSEEYGGLGESYETATIAFEALGYACKNNGDFLALSFVSTKEDVLAAREILNEQKSNMKIIAKIESKTGIDNSLLFNKYK